MKKCKIAILSLMACAAAVMQAKTDDVVVLGKGTVYLSNFEIKKDDATGEEYALWPSTENAWITDTCWAENVPVLSDSEAKAINIALSFKSSTYTPLTWMLTEEEDETVLHCYLKMPPCDVLTNLWLASEETAILDRETGVQYRAKRTVPECWKKHLGVKAPKGSVLDLKIYFPRLPKSTRNIAIYGVPVWNMRGLEVKLKSRGKNAAEKYDEVPEFKTPRLVKAEGNYNKDDHNTWAVYTDPHLIKPVKGENVMALWRTPEATYLAMAIEQNWMREYYGFHPGMQLVANGGGGIFELKEVLGLPKDHIFWMEGNSGDYLAYVCVFEPLPLDVDIIHFYEPDGEPFEMWGANWKGENIMNLDVDELRANQHLFEYKMRKVVDK